MFYIIALLGINFICGVAKILGNLFFFRKWQIWTEMSPVANSKFKHRYYYKYYDYLSFVSMDLIFLIYKMTYFKQYKCNALYKRKKKLCFYF